MPDIDVTKLSDAELMALIQGGQQVQPTDAQTGQPLPHDQAQTYAQLAAAGGIDPRAQPGSSRFPKAQRDAADMPGPGEFYVGTDGKVRQAPAAGVEGAVSMGSNLGRSFARGVPVLGAWADEADAATNAFLSPAIEPALRAMARAGIPSGYDERSRLDNIKGFGDRYHAALNMQRLADEGFDNTHPVLSTGAKVGGTVAGTVAALPALAAGSSMLPVEAGLIPRMAVGAGEGGAAMGLQGYGEGSGDLSDPSRLRSAEVEGVLGALGGGAAPAVFKGLGMGWNATGGKVVDALRRSRPAVRPAEEAIAEALANNESLQLPAALRPAIDPDRALMEALSARSEVPTPSVPATAEDDAYARIVRALSRQRQTPEQAIQGVQELGPMGMLADTGDAVRNLARDAANRPSGAEDIMRRALEARQRGVLDPATGEFTARPSSLRILDAAADNLGVEGKQFHSEFDVLNDVQKTAAKPLYDQVREFGPVESPTLQKLSTRPSVKRAMARAYQIAREDGRDPEGLGLVAVEAPENWVSEAPEAAVRLAEVAKVRGPAKAPTQGRSLAKFIADGGGLQDSQGELAAMDAGAWHKGKAFQRSLIGNGAPADDWALKAWEQGYFPELAERPTERQLYDALAAEMRGKARFARAPDQGAAERFAARDAADEAVYRGGHDQVPSPEDYVGRPAPVDEPAWQGQPTAETWDYVKRGLDDELEKYRDKTTGKLVLNGEGRAVLKTLDELRGELKNLVPVYGEALDAYSGPAALKDALEAGRSFAREDAPDLGKRLADLSTGERKMYRLGVLQGLKDKLGNADVTYDAARQAGLLKPNQLERFKELFPNQTAFTSFIRQMQNEQTMFQTRGAVLGNSSTAKQLLHAQDNDEAMLTQALSAGLAAKTGNPAAVLNILKTWGGPRKMSEPTAEAIASILTNMDQGGLPALTQRLTAAQQAQIVADQIRKMSVTGAAQAPARLLPGQRN